jgi:hypothetical protein
MADQAADLEHDSGKVGTGFPKGSCSKQKIEREDDSKKSHPDLDRRASLPKRDRAGYRIKGLGSRRADAVFLAKRPDVRRCPDDTTSGPTKPHGPNLRHGRIKT